jgi:MFS family permease
VSAVGSEISLLAIPLTAAVLLGASPLQMGLLTAAGTAPYAALGLVAGAWIDRLPRRRPLLASADAVAACALLSVPAAHVLGLLSVGQLLVVELLVGCTRVVFRPGFQAHLPDVVPDDELEAATAHLRAAESGAALSGPPVGGALVSVLSAPLAVLVDALTYVVSAVLLLRVRATEQPPAEVLSTGLRSQIGAGLVYLWQDRRMRAIAGTAANLNFFGMAVMALLVVYLTRDLDFSPMMVAAVLAAAGGGALLGALVAPRVSRRIGRGRTLLLAAGVFSVAMFAFPLAGGPHAVALAVLMLNELVVGVAVMLFDVTVGAFVLRDVPRRLHGRVFASMGTLTQGVKPLGAVAGGALASTIGVRPTLWMAAVGGLTTVLWMWRSPFRGEPQSPDAAAQSGPADSVAASGSQVGAASSR